MRKLLIILFTAITLSGYCQFHDMPIDTTPNFDVIIKCSNINDERKAEEIIERVLLHYGVLKGNWNCNLWDSTYYYCEVPDSMHTVQGRPSRLDYIAVLRIENGNVFVKESPALNDGIITAYELYFILSNHAVVDRKKLTQFKK